MIYQFNLYIDLNSWCLDREEDRDLPQPHSIFFFPLAAKTNWTLRPFPFSSFFPATAAFRFKGTRQPSTPAHQHNGALHFLRTWVRSLTCLVAYSIMFWRPDWFDSGRWICLLQSCWYCVTRAFLYFIGSWVALSFKVCESIRHQ